MPDCGVGAKAYIEGKFSTKIKIFTIHNMHTIPLKGIVTSTFTSTLVPLHLRENGGSVINASTWKVATAWSLNCLVILYALAWYGQLLPQLNKQEILHSLSGCWLASSGLHFYKQGLLKVSSVFKTRK